MNKTLAALLFGALAIATPAMAQTASVSSFNITDVIRASDADLTAAIADATAHNDTFAVQCYTGVQAYNTANPQKVPSITKPAGVVSAFQAGRDVVKGVTAPGDLVPKEIVAACGPLYLDIRGDVLKASAGPAATFLGFKL